VMAAEQPEFESWVQRMREGGPQTTGLPPAQDPAAGALVINEEQVQEQEAVARRRQLQPNQRLQKRHQ